MKRHIKIIEDLIRESKVGDSIINIENITDGYAGFVYKVAVTKGSSSKSLAVKLVPSRKDRSKKDILERVYGSRFSNFKPAYETLQKNAIKVPEIYFYSEDSKNLPYARIVMEYLSGISIRSFLEYSSHQDMNGLHELCGREFAKMHLIHRSFDGYASDKSPNKILWAQAFSNAFEILMNDLLKKEQFDRVFFRKLENFYSRTKDLWVEPAKFVFSHIDGFQGIAQYQGRWKFKGVIDFEDHKYIDQRFVLAGYELSLEYENRVVPDCFYQAYESIIEIDSTFSQVKDLYKVFYLLSWYKGFVEKFEGNMRDKARIEKKFMSSFAKFI